MSALSAEQLFVLLQQLFKDVTELFPAQGLIDARAGLTNSTKVTFITENTRVKRPLAATPGPSLMHRAPHILVVKNAVMIHDLHLHHRTGNPPVFFLNLLLTQAQFGDHPLLIVLVQRDRCFALTAIATAGAVEDIRELRGYFFHVGFTRFLPSIRISFLLRWALLINHFRVAELSPQGRREG